MKRILLTILLASAIAAPALAAPPTPFTSEIASHFAAWDKNSNGSLDPAELDSLVADKNLTGKTAAALGALKSAQRNPKLTLPPITLDYLHAYEQQVADHKRPVPNFDRSLDRALKKISAPKRDLLTGEKPTLDACHQGPLGDCFFVSVIGAAVARDPDSVRNMITTAADGSFIVAFGNGHAVRIDPLTDAEIALTSTTDDNSLWLATLEKAYGSLRNAALPEAKQTESTTDTIARGGSAGKSIQLLTGHDIDRLSFRPRIPRPAPVKAEVPKPDAAKPGDEVPRIPAGSSSPTPIPQPPAPKPVLITPDAPKPLLAPIDPEILVTHLTEVLPKVREHLIASIRDRRLIAAATPDDIRMPPGLTPQHAYAVLDYDEKSDTIHLWNPHGNTFTPKGDPSPASGYPTKSGHFTMPLTEFAHVFIGMSFETDKPLAVK